MVRIYATPGTYIDRLGCAIVMRNLGIRKVPSARLISLPDNGWDDWRDKHYSAEQKDEFINNLVSVEKPSWVMCENSCRCCSYCRFCGIWLVRAGSLCFINRTIIVFHAIWFLAYNVLCLCNAIYCILLHQHRHGTREMTRYYLEQEVLGRTNCQGLVNCCWPSPRRDPWPNFC
jgi:hypothetical protein